MSTYGKNVTHVDGEMFNAVEWNKLIDYVTYDTYALAIVGTAGWGAAERLRMVAVSGEGKWYYWNGSSLTGFPSVGGSGAPTDASYLTINVEAGLSAETQHENLTNVTGHLHEPKYHKASHQDGGADEISVTGLSGVLADDQDADHIKGVTVDDTDKANGKTLVFNSGTGNLEYEAFGAGTGDMTKAVYDTDADNVVESADNADTVDTYHAAAFALVTHKDTHKTGGGANAFLITDLLDGLSRINIAKSGAVIGTRRGIDFIPGTGVTLTVTDVPGTPTTEKVTVQIDTTASTEPHDILSTQHSDTTIATEVDGSILQYVTNKWVQKKSKRGIATVANGGTIAHGLGLTPTTVFVNAKALQPYATGWNVDGTNITVYHNAAGSLTVSYWAIE